MKLKVKKIKLQEANNNLKAASLDFDKRWDAEFDKYVDVQLTVEEFDAIMQKMLAFE